MTQNSNRYHGRNLAYDDGEDPDDILRVSAGSDPHSVASAISNAFYGSNDVVLRTLGAGAANQAIKAVAIARGYVAPRGLDLICRPGFTNVEGRDGLDRTALVFRLTLV